MIYQFRLTPDKAISIPFSSIHIEEFFGLTPEQVKEDATELLNRIDPRDYERFVDAGRLSAQQMTSWQCEFRVKSADNRVRWLFGNSSPELEPDGSILWTGYIKDITENKQLQQSAIMGGIASPTAHREAETAKAHRG